MPRCLSSTARLVAEADLPILPFLAPGIFYPWLYSPKPRSRPRRTYSAVAGGRHTSGDLEGSDHSTTTEKCQSRQDRRHLAREWYENTVAGKRTTPRARAEVIEEEDPPLRGLGQPLPKDEIPTADTKRSKIEALKTSLKPHWNGDVERESNPKPPSEKRRNVTVRRPLLTAQIGRKESFVRAAANEKKAQRSGDDRKQPSPANTQRIPKAKEFGRDRPSRTGSKNSSKLRAFSETPHGVRIMGNSNKPIEPKSHVRLGTARSKFVSLGYPVRRPTTDTRGRNPGSVAEQGENEEAETEEVVYMGGDYSSRWNRNFAYLHSKYDEGLKGATSDMKGPSLDPRAAQWAAFIFRDATAGILDTEAFEKGEEFPWKAIWRDAMIWTLHNNVDHALRFLRVTHGVPYLPISWVEDVIQYLASHWLKFGEERNKEAYASDLLETFRTISHRPNGQPLRIEGSALRLMLPYLDADQVSGLLAIIRYHRVEVHWNTLLHFVTRLASLNHFNAALEALLSTASAGADINSPQFKSNCATILLKAISEPDSMRVSLRIISNLVALGVKLNVQLCNIVLLSAVRLGDLKTAFSIFNSLLEHGVEADRYTYAILLKGCKGAVDDSVTLNSAIRQAVTAINVRSQPLLATEILHALYLHHSHHYQPRAWPMLLDAYLNLFSAQPLIQLGMLPSDTAQPEGLQEPTEAGLGIVITAYLRSQDRQARLDLWTRFQTLVKAGVPQFVRLRTTDYVANAFVAAFVAAEQTAPLAFHVLDAMAEPLPSNLNLNLQPAPPSPQTWNILHAGLSRLRLREAAARVGAEMGKRGVEIEGEGGRVGWTGIVGAHVGEGMRGAVGALGEMEREGRFSPLVGPLVGGDVEEGWVRREREREMGMRMRDAGAGSVEARA
ncbi:hypothetical protein M8818_002235 [Zalaria obscura]|uniref:Uncharacterized protein n=1 Tax=Zalaria obscura TaxID=2024903 RepID=A0ACC3SIU3_9PEZI